MKKINIWVAALAAVLSSSGSLHAQGALSVTISPSDSQVIAVDGQVNLGCSPTGGCEPYSFSWSIPGASGSPPTTDEDPGNVAFGSSAEGNVNTVTVTVTDANGNTEEASVEVGVPKFDTPDDIWFFEDGEGNSTYPVERDYVVNGVPSGKTVTWKIVGQSNAVKFNNNQQQIVGTDTTRSVKSIGWSSTENNLTLDLLYSGATVATSDTFTVRAPTKTSQVSYVTDNMYGGTQPLSSGFSSRYSFLIKDKFDQLLPGISASESFSTFTSLYSGENWDRPQAVEITLGQDSQLNDEYAGQYTTKVPTTVLPGSTGASTQVISAPQKYRVGGSGTSYSSGTGFIVKSHDVTFCRGKAYQH
jgi:hypothetical protein